MKRVLWFCAGILAVALGFEAGVFGFLANSPAAESGSSTIQTTRWEYRTETVEPGSLALRLNEWGNDRWDVFSVERGDASVETTDKPRLKVENFQITARRPKN